MFALAEREFIHVRKVENEPADVVLAPIIDVVIPEKVIVGVIERAGPREIPLEQQAVRESFLAADLKRVELHRGIVGEIFDRLRPAVLREEKPSLVGAERSE